VASAAARIPRNASSELASARVARADVSLAERDRDEAAARIAVTLSRNVPRTPSTPPRKAEIAASTANPLSVAPEHDRVLHLSLAARRDVVMGCDPASARHGPMLDGQDAAVRQLDRGVGRLIADRDGVAPLDIGLLGHLGGRARLHAKIDDFAQAHAPVHLLWRESVDLRVAPVAEQQALLPVEHAESFGHVVQRGVEVARGPAHPGGLHRHQDAEQQDDQRERARDVERSEEGEEHFDHTRR
jgi:hypothetical protein